MKKLVIDRSKWLRGGSQSRLLNESGSMCCLGFYCAAAGVPTVDMLNVPIPLDLPKSERVKVEELFETRSEIKRSTDACFNAIQINDCINGFGTTIYSNGTVSSVLINSSEERENLLKKEFLKFGYV